MNDSFTICNARLRGREGLYQIEISNGKIESIGADHNGQSEEEVYDAKGRLVCPQFCENHIHLDYAYTAGIPRANQSGTLFEAIEIWRDRKEQGLNTAEEIKKNAIKAAKSCVQHGTGFIRTHVDVTDPNLVALKALLSVKQEIKEWCELQIVAFPQNSIYGFPDGSKLMKQAMDLGADVVGGIPHLEPTYDDGIKSLRFIFDLAQKYGKLIDVHCDEIDDPSSRFIDVLAAETSRRGMQGQVTASHACSMAFFPTGYIDRLLPKLKAADIGFAIAPRENLQLQGRGFETTPRAVAPVKKIKELGMRVAFCQDSICDPWYAIGDGNPVRNMDTGLAVSHMLTAADIESCLDHITTMPATNMALKGKYGIEEGFPANMLVVDAQNDSEVLTSMPSIMLSIHNGREVFRRPEVPMSWADFVPDP